MAYADFQVYLHLLKEHAAAAGCAIHAYALMSNHVHLLLSCPDVSALATLMKPLGQRFTQYINRRYQRSGTLWDGRFHSCLTQEERYFMVCQRYIELNPVRARIVGQPGDYPWSSFQANALGIENSLIQPHSLYLALGRTPEQRQGAYRTLFDEEISARQLQTIRCALVGGLALGDVAFVERIATEAGRGIPRPRVRLFN